MVNNSFWDYVNGPGRDRVLQLIQDRERVEGEIRELHQVLESNNVDMDAPLVDREGFPRNDIDVYKVRHARHRIICLQNDHRNLMKKIEEGLIELHADLRASGGRHPTLDRFVATCTTVPGSSSSSNSGANEPCSIAIVGYVSYGSPADTAGLCEKDEILEFGSVNYQNFKDMSQIVDILGHSVGKPINVKVRRDQNTINVNVVPKPWQQPGLLGCQILRKV